MPSVLVPIITSVGAAIGGTTGAFLIMESAAVASGIILGGLVAFGAAQAKRAKEKMRAAYNAAQVDRMANVVAAVGQCELVLGRVRKGGVVWFRDSAGTKKEIFGMAMALAAHEIDAVEQVYCNDVAVELDEDGWVITEPWGRQLRRSVPQIENIFSGLSASAVADASGEYTIPDDNLIPESVTCYQEVTLENNQTGREIVPHTLDGNDVSTLPYALIVWDRVVYTQSLRIWWNLGADDQAADAWLQATFPGSFTADHRARGVANLFVEARYDETAFTGGLPRITVRLRGAKVLDPRDSTTAWSENPALLMRHVYEQPWFGRSVVTADEDARIIAAANACDDEYAYTVDGVEQDPVAMYRAALVVPFGTPAADVLDDLAQAMGGSWCHARGELFVRAGAYTAAVMTLTEDDLAVISTGADGSVERRAVTITPHRERAQQINTINVRLWDSAADYRETALAPLAPAALVARDGSTLAQEVMMPAIGYAPQALHVAGIILRDSRDPLTISATFKLRAIQLEVFDTVTLQLPLYGIDGEFTVQSTERPGDGTVDLVLKEVAAQHFQPDADFVPGGYADNTTLPEPWAIPDVQGLAVSETLAVQADGTVAANLAVVWDAISHQAVEDNGRIDVQWVRLGLDAQWQQRSVDGDQAAVLIPNAVDGDLYRVRARARSPIAVGDWSAPVNYAVVGKTAAPAAFDSFTAAAQPDGTREFGFAYTTTARPLDWAGAEIRYLPGLLTEPDWADMLPLNVEQTYYTASPVESNQLLAGEYTFACRSRDSSGNLSAALYVQADLPGRRLGDTVDERDEASDGWTGTLTDCHINDANTLEADNQDTWDDLSTWDAWTRWNSNPASPIEYITPVRDLGGVITGLLDVTLVADGTTTVELRYSQTSDDPVADPGEWSAWGDPSLGFTARYYQVRVEVAASMGDPVPLITALGYLVSAPITREYLNDVDISALTGSYRIGTGDVRVPLSNTYSNILTLHITVQDGGTSGWTWDVVDKTLTYGPRVKFWLNGTPADPALVDFYFEGF